MYDVIDHVREGNAFQVRLWLDNTENDLDQGDDHRFSLLHWAAKAGKSPIVDMLIQRGARVNATNMGDDTPLHLAVAHSHLEVVTRLIQARANVNAVNEHGNTPLHYACFWNNTEVAEELVNHGASISVENKYSDTPLDKARARLGHLLEQRARQLGQSGDRQPFKDAYWLGTKTRSRDATLSRQDEVDLTQLKLLHRISINHGGEVWRGTFRDSDTVAKVLRLRQCTVRNSRDFGEEYPKLRIFNHPNVLAVLGAVNKPPNLIVLSLYMPYGSLFDVLHVSGTENSVVVDANQALRFALDIANGMDFLHSPDLKVSTYNLNSKHVMIDEDVAKLSLDAVSEPSLNRVNDDLTAKLNMADCRFSFHEKAREYNPAWIAPEALQRKATDLNKHAADMWSFGILLWELETRQVPFSELSPTEIGMKVAMENLRVPLSPGMSRHMTKLIPMCCNENPGKRPKFDMLIPIFEKMRKARE